jgi:hypothetical protein
MQIDRSSFNRGVTDILTLAPLRRLIRDSIFNKGEALE